MRMRMARVNRLCFSLLVLLMGTAFAAADSGPATLKYYVRGKSNRVIVFVDGLSSDPDKTFRWGQGIPSWPELMAADTTAEKQQLPLSRYDLAALSFTNEGGSQRSIPQLATKALAELKSKGLLDGYESISFVGYSAGGLVLKSMLIQASIAGSSPLTAKTKTVFLLSVPAQGKAAAEFLTQLGTQRPLVQSVTGKDAGVFLQGLESLWSEFLATRGPTRPLKIYCLRETEPTYGSAVKPGQYATEGCDESSEQSGTDHTTIAKPGSREAGTYRWVEAKLASYFQRFPSDPGKAKVPPVSAAATSVVASNDPATTASTKPAATPAPAAPAKVAATPTPAPVPAPAPAPAKVAAVAQPATAPVPPSTAAAATSVAASTPAPATTNTTKPLPATAPSTTVTPRASSLTPLVPIIPAPSEPAPPPRSRVAAIADPAAGPAPAPAVRAVAALPLVRPAPRRPAPPPLQSAGPVPGNWTFSLKGQDCNLPEQLWVVSVRDRKIRSDNWRANISSDGKFVSQRTSSCATELVRGTISGKRGSGWYLYADPCNAMYCRVKFKMTWRLPESAWKRR
jgi:hypothetical protein